MPILQGSGRQPNRPYIPCPAPRAGAGPPTTPAPSGLTPSDSCYVKHLPATYGVSDLLVGGEGDAASWKWCPFRTGLWLSMPPLLTVSLPVLSGSPLPAWLQLQEVQQLFETHGAVLDVKLFPCLGENGAAHAAAKHALHPAPAQSAQRSAL